MICQTVVGRALRLLSVARVSIAHPRQAMRLPYNPSAMRARVGDPGYKFLANLERL